MPILVSKGVVAEVYTKAEVDALLAAVAPGLEERLAQLELDLDAKVDGVNGVNALWAGTSAELAAIDPKDPATVYVANDEPAPAPEPEPEA